MADNRPDLFELTEVEKHQALWIKLSAYLRTRLTALREQNDFSRSEVDTAITRGQIMLVKSLIAIGDAPPQDGR
jgi:hypothetical protein